MNIAGETNAESNNSWQKPSVLQGYDSAGFTFTPEETQTFSSWSTQFGSDIEFLHVMNGNQNINGNGGSGGPVWEYSG